MSKNQNSPSIERCPHDSKNPYTMINNALIRDNSISPNCRFILIYLLANINDWSIKICQLASQLNAHLGRDKVYKIINEAVEAGYMKKEEYNCNDPSLSKNLKRVKYLISETPKFKKSIRLPGFQELGNPDPDSKDCTEYHKKERPLEQLLCTSGQSPQEGGKLSIKRKDHKGQEKEIHKDDLIFNATRLKKDWTIAEIESAWIVLCGYDKISDPFKLMDGIISNSRVKEYNKKQRKKLCPSMKDLNQNNQPSTFYSEPISEKPTSEQPLLDWRQMLKQ